MSKLGLPVGISDSEMKGFYPSFKESEYAKLMEQSFKKNSKFKHTLARVKEYHKPTEKRFFTKHKSK